MSKLQMIVYRECLFGIKLLMAFAISFSSVQMFRLWVMPQTVVTQDQGQLKLVVPVVSVPGAIDTDDQD